MAAEEARVFGQLEDLCGEIPLPEYQTYRPPTIQLVIEHVPNPLCWLALLPLYVLCFNAIVYIATPAATLTFKLLFFPAIGI